ncbi:MAG: hypothetical protein ACKOW9_04405 [Candidatus Paceibacterota bacterium]
MEAIKKLILVLFLTSLSLTPVAAVNVLIDMESSFTRKQVIKITSRTNPAEHTTCIFVNKEYWDCGISFDTGLYAGMHLYAMFGYRDVSIRVYDNKTLKVPPSKDSRYLSKSDFTIKKSEGPSTLSSMPTVVWSRMSVYKNQTVELYKTGSSASTICSFYNGRLVKCQPLQSVTQTLKYKEIVKEFGVGVVTFRTYQESRKSALWQTPHISSSTLNVHPASRKPPIPAHLMPRKTKGNKPPSAYIRNLVVPSGSSTKHQVEIRDPDDDEVYVLTQKAASGLSVVYEKKKLIVNVWDNITGQYQQQIQLVDSRGGMQMVKFNITVVPEKVSNVNIKITLVCKPSGQLQVEQEMQLSSKPSHEGYIITDGKKYTERLPLPSGSKILISENLKPNTNYYVQALGKDGTKSDKTKISISPQALLEVSNRSVRCEKLTAVNQV